MVSGKVKLVITNKFDAGTLIGTEMKVAVPLVRAVKFPIVPLIVMGILLMVPLIKAVKYVALPLIGKEILVADPLITTVKFVIVILVRTLGVDLGVVLVKTVDEAKLDCVDAALVVDGIVVSGFIVTVGKNELKNDLKSNNLKKSSIESVSHLGNEKKRSKFA